MPFMTENIKLISSASAHKLQVWVRRFCRCLVSEVRNSTCFFQLISLICLAFLKTFVAVLCFVNYMMMFCLPSLSIVPILWDLSTSFSVISGSCKSLFIMSITDFVTDASVSFLQLPGMVGGSTVPGNPVFPVTHLSYGLQEQAAIPKLRCCYQEDLVFFQGM